MAILISEMLTVILPDGSRKQFEGPTTAYDVAAGIGPGLAKAAILAEVDGKQVDLRTPLPASGEIKLRLLTKKDPEALAVMRHRAAHVMARAVMRLFDGVQLAFGPTIDNGFYYDFAAAAAALGGRLSADRGRDGEDRQGRRAVRAARRCRAAEALELCRDLGQALKVEHIQDRSGRPVARLVLSPGRVHRSVPRAAHSQRRRHRRVQAALGRRRLLERRRLAAAVAAALRHRRSSTRRSWTTICSRSKRPSAATIACWASSSNCSPSTRRSARA